MRKSLLLIVLFACLNLKAESNAKWEYGVGLGFIRFEQYPAAGEYSEVWLPFPTFQYRGRTFRADDREGAKAYLWKNDKWTVEMSGTGSPYLDSKNNQLRKSMKDIPWIFAVGPELVYKLSTDFYVTGGIFQAVATDFQVTEFSGAFFQSQITYSTDCYLTPTIKSYTKYFLTAKSATSEVQNKYFGVSDRDVTVDRPRYQARSGFLSLEASIFQSFKIGKVTYYLGANYAHYGLSANQKSPLYKSNYQFNYLFGLTYVLGESVKQEVEEEDTSGILNRKK